MNRKVVVLAGVVVMLGGVLAGTLLSGVYPEHAALSFVRKATPVAAIAFVIFMVVRERRASSAQR